MTMNHRDWLNVILLSSLAGITAYMFGTLESVGISLAGAWYYNIHRPTDDN